MFTKEEVLKTATQMLNGNEPSKAFITLVEKTIVFRDRVAVLDFSVTDVAMMLAVCNSNEKTKPVKPKVKATPPPKDTEWGKVEKGTPVLLASGSIAKFIKMIDEKSGIAEVFVDDADAPEKIPTESLVLK